MLKQNLVVGPLSKVNCYWFMRVFYVIHWAKFQKIKHPKAFWGRSCQRTFSKEIRYAESISGVCQSNKCLLCMRSWDIQHGWQNTGFKKRYRHSTQPFTTLSQHLLAFLLFHSISKLFKALFQTSFRFFDDKSLNNERNSPVYWPLICPLFTGVLWALLSRLWCLCTRERTEMASGDYTRISLSPCFHISWAPTTQTRLAGDWRV